MTFAMSLTVTPSSTLSTPPLHDALPISLTVTPDSRLLRLLLGTNSPAMVLLVTAAPLWVIWLPLPASVVRAAPGSEAFSARVQSGMEDEVRPLVAVYKDRVQPGRA